MIVDNDINDDHDDEHDVGNSISMTSSFGQSESEEIHDMAVDESPRKQGAESVASGSSSTLMTAKVRPTSSDDCVKVAVRIRPLLPLERQEPCLNILDESSQDADSVGTSVRVGSRRTGVTYTFDCVYGPNTSQAKLYQHSVVPLLDACLEGYNATILAYGQTGSGKTHTILGNHVTGDSQGVLPRTIHALFDALPVQTNDPNKEHMQSTAAKQHLNSSNKSSDRPCDECKVHVQFLEIYGEEIRDLLCSPAEDAATHHSNSNGIHSSNKLTIRDGGLSEEPEVLGVVQHRVYSASEALQILQTGRLRRVTAATAMNATSSRSHALFTIIIEQTWNNGPTATSAGGATVVRRSKFHFVDLAGSERAKRTQAVGLRLKEGIEINKGLLVLGNVIAALASGQGFIPYRDSKLTRLLRGSLGGNHKTIMIACVSPSADNMEESLNCLRYANRAKQIQNKATINLDPTSQYIITLQQHISKLAQQALFHFTLTSSSLHEGGSAASKEGSAYTMEQLQALASGESMERVLAGLQSSLSSDLGPGPSGTASMRPLHSNTGPTIREGPLVIPSDEAEESLYWQKAQSSMNQVWQNSSDNITTKSDSDMYNCDDSRDDAVVDRTMQKMVEYEREIGALKKALAVEISQRAMIQEEQSWMDEVQKSLQEDRNRLKQLQHNLDDDKDDEASAMRQMEAEEKAEQDAVQSWTKKYGRDDGDDNDDDTNEGSTAALGTTHPSKHRMIQEDLMELSRSIAAKEELIGQLRVSQERYEMMRDFYEAKLKEMEHSLMEKEEEREELLKKLDESQTAKAGSLKSQELREKLQEKEAHIALLKKKSAELRTLTDVSSRNANEIARLARDVEDMKRRKVDLQKQLTVERKNHATTIKRLQMEATHKERELAKYKRLTTQKEIEAEKANQIAKNRLAELGVLRQKYRDSELKHRMQSVKRGVMAKAGLDPVLVGRRDNEKNNIDIEALRNLFDEKVSKVAKKEALVNKLAEEWEQHFQLSSKRDELAQQAEISEDLENIELQLKYKEDRIRNLAKRLEKVGTTDSRDKNGRADNKESFLFDAQYEKVCKSAPADVAHKALAKVLFGMVVRERRRVAALARTACSLDDRLQTAAEDLEAKETALRAYVDEQRAQVAEMTQNQQNHILSLMELVKEDQTHPRGSSNGQISLTANQNDDFDETLLALANERISLLEQQLEIKASEAEAALRYRAEMEELKGFLQHSQGQNKALEEELQNMTAEMRTIKAMLAGTPGRGVDVSKVINAVDRVLGQESGDNTAQTRKSGPSKKVSSLPAAIKAMDLDESDPEDGNSSVEPEWANEIMQDLALIAEGKIPPSLKDVPGFEEQHKEIPVFERLANPENFTGTQKQAQMRNRPKQKGRNPPQSLQKDTEDLRGTDRDSGRTHMSSASRSSSKSSTSSNRPFVASAKSPSVGRIASPEPRARISSPDRRVARFSFAGRKDDDAGEPQKRPANVFNTSAKSSALGRISSPERRAPRVSLAGRKDEDGAEQHHGNVFDRLSSQSTFSFSVKHMDEEAPLPSPRLTSVDALLDEVLGVSNYNGHSCPDVFERLTKTTTEAYAMKRK